MLSLPYLPFMQSSTEVELGYIEKSPHWRLDSRFFPSKVGGKPAWLDLTILPPDPACKKCGKTCAFLLQLYAPLQYKDSCFHRSFFVFICKDASCCEKNSNQNFRVFRSQLPRCNPYYPYTPPIEIPTWNKEFSVAKWCKLCDVCGAAANSSCGRCKTANYCTRLHQRLAWKGGHKKVCGTGRGNVPVATDFLLPEYELCCEPEGDEDHYEALQGCEGSHGKENNVEPVVTENSTEPTTNKNDTDTVANENDTDNVANKNDTELIVNKNDGEPVDRNDAGPIENAKDAEAILNKNDSKPVANGNDTESFINDNDKQPVKQKNNTGAIPKRSNTGAIPKNSNTGAIPKNSNTGAIPKNSNTGAIPKNSNTGAIPKNSNTGAIPKNSNTGAIPKKSKQPVANKKALEPVVNKKAVEPVVNKKALEPAMNKNALEPVGNKKGKKHKRLNAFGSKNAMEPIVNKEAMEPVVNKEAVEPIKNMKAMEPAVNKIMDPVVHEIYTETEMKKNVVGRDTNKDGMKININKNDIENDINKNGAETDLIKNPMLPVVKESVKEIDIKICMDSATNENVTEADEKKNCEEPVMNEKCLDIGATYVEAKTIVQLAETKDDVQAYKPDSGIETDNSQISEQAAGNGDVPQKDQKVKAQENEMKTHMQTINNAEVQSEESKAESQGAKKKIKKNKKKKKKKTTDGQVDKISDQQISDKQIYDQQIYDQQDSDQEDSDEPFRQQYTIAAINENGDFQMPELAKIFSGEATLEDLEKFAMAENDRMFRSFQDRIQRHPTHVLRYCINSGEGPLWVSKENILPLTEVPRCEKCNAHRCFEFQVMPQLLNFLGLDREGHSIDWGTLVVYSCSRSCDGVPLYKEEYLYKQDYSDD